MAARNKPYEQFGPFILFKKLETDALGDLWRAGRIEGGALGATVAIRRLSGGDRPTVAANVDAIAQILPRISGTSFVREQHAGVIDGVPFLAWDYAGGRSLRHIINAARGGANANPNPLPMDQAVVIAEKVALSLATMADLRETSGARLSHGALIPQFIWISDDGEIRVAGQLLGSAILASLTDQSVYADIARYFAPEHRQPGMPHKNADVYSMGAILFLLVTGQEPPDAATASAFGAAVRAARTMSGTPIPDDIRVILDKSFNLDPSMRYASMADMKQAITALGGKYSATTFNLAFYLNTLLKKEMEAEAADRDKEAKVAIAPYLEQPKAAPAPAPVAAAGPTIPVPPPVAPPVISAPPARKSKAPIAIAAGVVLALLGGGAYMMWGKSGAQPAAKQVVTASTIPTAPAQPRLISQPIAVEATPATSTAPMTPDAEAQKKAFEEAVAKRLQDEMMKLQTDFMEKLKKEQSKNAPVPVPAAAEPARAAVADERPAISAAQLDQQRRDTRPEPAVATATTQPVQQQPQVTQTSAPAPAVAVPAPVQQAASSVREGDVVDVGNLDVLPRITRSVKPVYPPLAARQKINATIFLTVLVSETGDVLDVKVLRGDSRFGLNDAAMRAMRGMRFSPAMKDGKRVRTWYPQSIEFKAN
jgi:TonB family protein